MKAKAENAQQMMEFGEKFQAFFNLIPYPVAIINKKGEILAINDKAEEKTGFKKRELLGKNFLTTAIVTEDSRAILVRNFAKRMKGIHVAPYEVEALTKDGRKLAVEVNAARMEYKGKPADLVMFHDVSERKMIKERLSALNFYGRRLNTADNLQKVYELTLDAMEQTLGFEHASFLAIDRGKLRVACQRGYPSPLHLNLPLDGTESGITVRAANSHKPVLVSDTRKDKDYVEGVRGIRSELAVPVETENKTFGVLNVESRNLGAFDSKDVTLLQILASHAATAITSLEKREEIEKRSSQLASLMKSSTKMISSTDLRQRLQTIAEAIKELGWQRVVISVRDENLEITDLVTEGLTEDEVKLLLERKSPGSVWRERLSSSYDRFRIGEFYYLPWNELWVRKNVHGVPANLPPEEATTYSGVPSKLAPEEMIDWHPQDMLYAPLRLPEGHIVGIISMDDPLDGRRPTRDSLVPLKLFLYQAAVAIENAQLIQQLNNAKNKIREYADQLELKVNQRTQELMEAQYRLLKAERLAAIGEVAAMVGHDLRNPLTGISGVGYYLKMKLGSKMSSKTREMLELLEKDIEYSNKIINDLLEYSGEIRLELKETTLKSIVKEALSLVEVPKNIRVSNLTQSEPRVEVDIERLKRAFVNIVKNAVDAMPKGGKLTIKSEETNDYLEIDFTDTGAGMSRDIIGKIGTPLFTTKAKGMGLGLSICKRILEAHGGSVSAKSTVGKGTTFTVTIPIKQKSEGGEKAWQNKPESLLSTMTKA
jgi:PAS domain S-box-containing protein